VVLAEAVEAAFSRIGMSWQVEEPVEQVDEVDVVVALASFSLLGRLGFLVAADVYADVDVDVGVVLRAPFVGLMISKETISKWSSVVVVVARGFFLLPALVIEKIEISNRKMKLL
jgi:hypothetical protein